MMTEWPSSNFFPRLPGSPRSKTACRSTSMCTVTTSHSCFVQLCNCITMKLHMVSYILLLFTSYCNTQHQHTLQLGTTKRYSSQTHDAVCNKCHLHVYNHEPCAILSLMNSWPNLKSSSKMYIHVHKTREITCTIIHVGHQTHNFTWCNFHCRRFENGNKHSYYCTLQNNSFVYIAK